ncbi:molybdopterin molybdotransferase MoeA [Anaeromyxobacter oryzae]|uniref:Molybdopterin molybdenumtransferase n=1 Tax=Anaeromyxobacter oryzae TaxID=2918170 RepID=A0ABN6MX97_9BACT|nr:gephyrin-like molybdotransferase Glp [Anaeromyxobacter oryzae]BDG05561.1 molybdopterin molybdenumtransferase MoeA [Anaeromyxobacter oryzae]
MPTFEEARATILDHVTVLGSESVPVLAAVGRVLAADVEAPWDMPLWDNSAMDGYAVRAADTTAAAGLRIAGYIPAGSHSSDVVAAGTAAKILTGAPLPPGADAVVPVEDTDARDGSVLVRQPVRPGAHVRRKGEDIRASETILRAGTVIGPSEVSLLASFSRLSIPVVRRPRVAILSTGDELVEAGGALAPGKIYDSNALAVAAAVLQLGGEPVQLGIARDDRASLRALLVEGLRADALVTSAGVSMGDRDLVREVLHELSVRQIFWKVDIKPGRPTAFAVHGSKPVFSLPGNPVSTLVTFEQFVRPALLKMMGHRTVLRPVVRAVFQEDFPRKPGRVSFLRVRLERRNGGLLAWTSGNQDTGILKTMLQADGIAVIPADWGSVGAGDLVDVQMLRGGVEA